MRPIFLVLPALALGLAQSASAQQAPISASVTIDNPDYWNGLGSVGVGAYTSGTDVQASYNDASGGATWALTGPNHYGYSPYDPSTNPFTGGTLTVSALVNGVADTISADIPASVAI